MRRTSLTGSPPQGLGAARWVVLVRRQIVHSEVLGATRGLPDPAVAVARASRGVVVSFW